MKKINIIIILLLVLVTAGCSKSTKEATTSDVFTQVLTDNNYKVSDYTQDFSFAEVALVAKKDEIEIVFVEGKKRYDIEGIFLDECNNIYSLVGTDYEKDSNKGSNWANLELVNDTNYYYVSWIGNTYLYVRAEIDSQSKIEDIIDELGY